LNLFNSTQCAVGRALTAQRCQTAANVKKITLLFWHEVLCVSFPFFLAFYSNMGKSTLAKCVEISRKWAEIGLRTWWECAQSTFTTASSETKREICEL